MIPSKGDVFVGTAVEVKPFGTFIEHPGGAHGLLHGAEVEIGTQVSVRVIDVDAERERFSLAKA
ncbi:S1 RNA-binding domain-containing protein [Actinokineospora soli]|uniref:S1 RNA-binding domain-containing protein n=1 Tax=Actinokineospora soli TaxID=1048753 RepID=A0ABW2TR03_9PSEU